MMNPDPLPRELNGLDPGELLARSLHPARPSDGANRWVPPRPKELAALLPQYEIHSLLGHGGTGAVYKGRQVALDRIVALKLLPAELADAEFIVRPATASSFLTSTPLSRPLTYAMGSGVLRYRGARKDAVAARPVATTPIPVPATMAGRLTAASRQRLMLANGGKVKSEEAVLRGLRWWTKNQGPDGSWGRGSRPAMTGFGLLCLLGHGETTASAEFGPAVGKAADWLMAQGIVHRGHLNGASNFNTNTAVYEHAIATLALAEYYSLTRDEKAASIFKDAVSYIVDGQGVDGGWMYQYDKSQSDTSVSGWQIQALYAAHLSRLDLVGVDAALDKAMLNLKRVQTNAGGFGYRQPGDRPGNVGYSLCGVGVLCSYLWKQDKDELVRGWNQVHVR